MLFETKDSSYEGFPVFCHDCVRGTVPLTQPLWSQKPQPYALNTCWSGLSRKRSRRVLNSVHIDIDVHPGDIVLGDCDGVVVVPQGAEDEVFAKAEAKFEKEEHLVEMLKAGKTTLEIYGFDNLIEKLKAI